MRRERFFEMVSKARARRGTAIMGVCNVTPDSFSDGGRHHALADARAHVDALLADGADIIDIGGESTRPNAVRVSASEQLARVLPVIEYASKKACVSIDTTDPEVARAALDAGASCVNDVSNLGAGDAMADVAYGSGAALVLSHAPVRLAQKDMRGYGGAPQKLYDDVVDNVLADFVAARNKAVARGVPASAIVMDPGLGFGKSARHSMELLRRTHELVTEVAKEGDALVLVGASRKSFLTLIDEKASPQERIGASIMAAAFAARAGAAIVRVHDVRATRQAIDLEIILDTPPGHGDGKHARERKKRGGGR